MNYFSIRSGPGQRSDFVAAQPALRQQGSLFFRSTAAFFCAVSLGLVAFHATAADVAEVAASVRSQAPITVNLKQFKVLSDAKGEVQFTDASAVLPGDVIEYRAVYSNRGATTLPVVATLPIPESLEYLKESASASNKIAHTVALKDSHFSKEPLVQKLVPASGVTESQPLPYASYRYVRWDLGNLSPGKSVEVSVRAKVAQNLAADATTEDKASALTSFFSFKK